MPASCHPGLLSLIQLVERELNIQLGTQDIQTNNLSLNVHGCSVEVTDSFKDAAFWKGPAMTSYPSGLRCACVTALSDDVAFLALGITSNTSAPGSSLTWKYDFPTS